MSDIPDKYDAIANRLSDTGWIIVPDFLSDPLAQELRDDVLGRYRHGAFRAAGVGRGGNWRRAPDIRNDHVLWMREPFTPAQARYLAELEKLRLAVNRALYLGLWDFEGHFTVYSPGSRYVRHLDRFSNAKHRRVTCIVYLNDEWRAEDGGQLRIYLEGENPVPFHDVLPTRGTLACFLSDTFYHEVLPATRERLSVTGWFRTRE